MLAKSLNITQSFVDFLKDQFVRKKFQSPLGILFLVVLSLVISLLISYTGILGFIGVLAIFLGIPAVVYSIFNHQFGIILMLFVGFLLNLISKYTEAPLGTALDGLLLIMIFGILIQQSVKKDWSFLRNPISIWVFFWVYYNVVIQFLNPMLQSTAAWMYTVRSLALLNLLYYVACNSFSSLEKIRSMLKWVIFFCLLAGVYAYKQEIFGLNDAENRWLYADKERFQLIFQWTRLRLFSVLNDPTTFGIMMAYCGVFSLVLATGPYSRIKKIMNVIAALFFFACMSLTGTRTAFVLVPIGLFFYVCQTITLRMFLLSIFALLLGTGAVMKSTSNPLIYRIQSAFKPSKDESVQVRVRNQKFIQPFIQAHPIGYGLGCTGVWGKRFTPDSWLSKFPHDSGYVRFAVEEGWIGLLIYVTFLFVVLLMGIRYYLRVKDPLIKNLYLAINCVIFILAVANYPQEAIAQLPTSLIFYILLACIVRLKDFDEHYVSVTASLKANKK
jgi:putative inorganic carbon (hco3(-)) transporter